MANWLGIADKAYKKKLPENFYMLLTPSEHIQQQLFWYGYYEKELGDMIKMCLKPGDVFLDIGANIGYFTLLAANSEPTSKVISFEPVKGLFQKLEENISINSFKNITAFNIAVGEINEETELFISGPNNSGMSSFRQPENYSGKKEIVKVVTIDSWFKTARLSKIDLIKLDVEGSELAALKGTQETLQNFKPLIIAEVNPETLASFSLTPGDIYGYLNKLNFDGFTISEKEGLKRVNPNSTSETKNVLFIHPDKLEFYQELFNK
jgi:FkbM family methyltransferase